MNLLESFFNNSFWNLIVCSNCLDTNCPMHFHPIGYLFFHTLAGLIKFIYTSNDHVKFNDSTNERYRQNVRWTSRIELWSSPSANFGAHRSPFLSQLKYEVGLWPVGPKQSNRNFNNLWILIWSQKLEVFI